jgi:glutamate carboxypeptidase
VHDDTVHRSPLGVPTLDGLRTDGDGADTEWEHGLISSIEPRTMLMRRLLETLQWSVRRG